MLHWTYEAVLMIPGRDRHYMNLRNGPSWIDLLSVNYGTDFYFLG